MIELSCMYRFKGDSMMNKGSNLIEGKISVRHYIAAFGGCRTVIHLETMGFLTLFSTTDPEGYIFYYSITSRAAFAGKHD